MSKYRGCSYLKRVREVNEIYDQYSKIGLSNREIWRRHIWPKFGICEKTFYNYIGYVLEELPAEPDLFSVQ